MATSSQATNQPAPGANVRLPRRRYAAIPLTVRAAIMRRRLALVACGRLPAAAAVNALTSNCGQDAERAAASTSVQGPWTCA